MNNKFRMLMITLFLIFGTAVQSQTNKISLSLKNITISQFVREIEKKTNYTFMLDNSVNQTKRFSIQLNEATIQNVLNKALACHLQSKFNIVIAPVKSDCVEEEEH